MAQFEFKYKMEIPVNVLYHEQDDGSILIDCVSIPDEDQIYKIVDQNAIGIKVAAKVDAGQ